MIEACASGQQDLVQSCDQTMHFAALVRQRGGVQPASQSSPKRVVACCALRKSAAQFHMRICMLLSVVLCDAVVAARVAIQRSWRL